MLTRGQEELSSTIPGSWRLSSIQGQPFLPGGGGGNSVKPEYGKFSIIEFTVFQVPPSDRITHSNGLYSDPLEKVPNLRDSSHCGSF